MFRKVWHVVKALMGRQDGRVPADPELHHASLSVTSAMLEALVNPTEAALAAASPSRRPCPLPPGQSLRQVPLPRAAETTSQQTQSIRPERRKLLSRRLASVAKLNGPASAKRMVRTTVAPAGKPVPRPGPKRKVRARKPQAWIIAARRRVVAKPQSVRPAASILAFPQAARLTVKRPARKAA